MNEVVGWLLFSVITLCILFIAADYIELNMMHKRHVSVPNRIKYKQFKLNGVSFNLGMEGDIIGYRLTNYEQMLYDVFLKSGETLNNVSHYDLSYILYGDYL